MYDIFSKSLIKLWCFHIICDIYHTIWKFFILLSARAASFDFRCKVFHYKSINSSWEYIYYMNDIFSKSLIKMRCFHIYIWYISCELKHFYIFVCTSSVAWCLNIVDCTVIHCKCTNSSYKYIYYMNNIFS